MKNNYFVLLVILLTWHFLQSRVQSCHRFKGRGSRTLLVFSSLASCTAIHADGSYTVKRQKKSAESSKHIDNPVHQTILHFLYAPFISDKKAAERFMPKWFPQLSCSSLGRWLKCWVTLSRGPSHPPVLPYRAGRDLTCSSSDKLISSISWVIFGSLDEVKDPVVTESWRDKFFLFSLGLQCIPRSVCSSCHTQSGRAGKMFHHLSPELSAPLSHPWGRQLCLGHSNVQNSQVFHNTTQNIHISMENIHAKPSMSMAALGQQVFVLSYTFTVN